MSVRQVALGFGIGLVSALVAATFIDLPMLFSMEPPNASSQTRWAKETGSKLMSRVGQQFVSGERTDPSTFVFYDQPKPMLNYLCRTNRYTIPVGLVRGRESYGREFWQANLDIRMVYGVWALPSDKLGRTRDQACASYNDFKHLITADDGSAADRGVQIADAARRAALNRTPSFRVTCIDQRQDGKSCDGNAVLRSLDVHKMNRVNNQSTMDLQDKTGIRRTDLLSFEQAPSQTYHPEGLVVEVTTFQNYANHIPDRITIESVAVTFEVY